MALIKCEECGHMVSDRATECPNCGCPIEKKEVEEKIVCEECGARIPASSLSCPECGCPIRNTQPRTNTSECVDLNQTTDTTSTPQAQQGHSTNSSIGTKANAHVALSLVLGIAIYIILSIIISSAFNTSPTYYYGFGYYYDHDEVIGDSINQILLCGIVAVIISMIIAKSTKDRIISFIAVAIDALICCACINTMSSAIAIIPSIVNITSIVFCALRRTAHIEQQLS